MKTQKISNILTAPKIIQGCMRFSDLSVKKVEEIIDTNLSLGINFFDHADIYGRGKSETLFAEAFKNLSSYNREDIILQSKCGIIPGVYFDNSKEYILKSADNILKRLNTDYLDVLLLHRADVLADPADIAEAFRILKDSGKVKYFGVSNHNSRQIALLNKYTNNSIIINQIQLSIAHCPIFDSEIYFNTTPVSDIPDNGLLSYSMENDITLQAWSPFQFGYFEGVFIDNDKFVNLNFKLKELAEKYNTNVNAIVTAWILHHSAEIQMIAGTTNVKRIKEIAQGADVKITKEEWYQLYTSVGKELP